MVRQTANRQSLHNLLIPNNLIVVPADADEDSVPPSMTFYPDDGDHLYWDSVDVREIAPEESWPALWGLLNNPIDSSAEVAAFASIWGVPGRDDEDWQIEYFDRPNWIRTSFFGDLAAEARRLLVLLALTAAEEAISVSLLEEIQDWAEWPPEDDELRMQFLTFQAFDKHRKERRWEQLLSEFRRDPVEVQGTLLGNRLSSLFGMTSSSYVWDERGRRIVNHAVGLDDIVLSHITTLFALPEIDIFVCSVCGAPYEFNTKEGQRRPRYGARRFCSDSCRANAKRESNRLSWKRNSAKWTKQRLRKGMRG